jgi:hypothetical protein
MIEIEETSENLPQAESAGGSLGYGNGGIGEISRLAKSFAA